MSAPPGPRIAFRFAAAAIVIALLGGVLFYFVDDPFAGWFWIALALAGGGAVLALLSCGLGLLRSPVRVQRVVGVLLAIVVVLVVVEAWWSATVLRGLLHPSLSADDWSRDVRALVASVVRQDPSPQARRDFPERAQELLRRLPELSDAQRVAGLAELMASLGDGHSMFLATQPATGFALLPLKLQSFADGLYVTDAAPAYKHLVGSKLTQVGAFSLDEARRMLRPLVSADNDGAARDHASLYLLVPEILCARGIVDDAGFARLGFSDERGRTLVETLSPVSMYSYAYWYFRPLARWKGTTAPGTLPPWRNYSFTLDAGKRALVLHLRRILDQRNEPFTEFASRFLAFAREQHVDRLVIDLRQNGGGDNTLVGGFVEELARSEWNARGRLFVLIGPQTFSAAVNFATLLENRTEAVFVGAPTGAGPNHYGDPRLMLLPRSKLLVTVSTRRWEFGDAADRRDALAPDVTIEPSYRDFARGADPALAFAATQPAPPLALAASPLRPDVVGPVVGRYWDGPDRALEVSTRDGALRIRLGETLDQRLHGAGSSEFRNARSTVAVRFVGAAGRSADAVLWSVSGRSRILVRLPADRKMPGELLQEGKLAESAAGYRQMHRDSPLVQALSEGELNSRGYRFLGARDYARAILLLSLNTELHPGSANTYDSLGEAYMLAGDRARAIESYRKCLVLRPQSANARRMLERLGS